MINANKGHRRIQIRGLTGGIKCNASRWATAKNVNKMTANPVISSEYLAPEQNNLL